EPCVARHFIHARMRPGMKSFWGMRGDQGGRTDYSPCEIEPKNKRRWSVMPKMEHVGTEQQGKYTYTIFVEESGGHWEWEVNRIPADKNEIVRVPAIAQGRAPSRDQAITTSY